MQDFLSVSSELVDEIKEIVKVCKKLGIDYQSGGLIYKRKGKEIEAIDYFIAKKILRKFEQLNISYIRDELDPYIEFLNKTFGQNKMKECIEYLMRLKKLV